MCDPRTLWIFGQGSHISDSLRDMKPLNALIGFMFEKKHVLRFAGKVQFR